MAETIGEHLNKYVVVVTKSTVPVGTSMQVKHIIQQKLNERGVNVPFDVASNPEFLKEGNAIKDFMSPDRVVVGVESDKAKEILTRLYKPFLLNNFRVLFYGYCKCRDDQICSQLNACNTYLVYE